MVYFQVISYGLICFQTSLMQCSRVPYKPATIIHFKGMFIIGSFYVFEGIFLCNIGHFGAPWRPFCISRPLIGRNTECSDQKTYLAKVVRSAHITIEK